MLLFLIPVFANKIPRLRKYLEIWSGFQSLHLLFDTGIIGMIGDLIFRLSLLGCDKSIGLVSDLGHIVLR